jgi:hypothetical protein
MARPVARADAIDRQGRLDVKSAVAAAVGAVTEVDE